MSQSKEKTLQQIAEFFGGQDTIMSQSAEKTALEIISLLGGNGVGWPVSLEHELEEIRDLLPAWAASQVPSPTPPAAVISQLVAPLQIGPLGIGSVTGILGAPGTYQSTSPPAANRPYAYLCKLDEELVVEAFALANFTTVSGNFDMAIYSAEEGSNSAIKIIGTGTTAQTGANSVQVVSVTPTTLQPGLYYFAIVFDNTSSTFIGQTVLTYGRAMGVIGGPSGTYPLPDGLGKHNIHEFSDIAPIPVACAIARSFV